MSTLSNRSKPHCNRSGSEQDSTSKVASGWEIDGSLFQGQNLSFKLINLANQKVSLYSVFKKYGLIFDQVSSATGWTHRGRCPFPSHSDYSPSFGYNSVDDRFNCFGCHRAGQAVEFISFMESRSKVEVARELMGGNLSNESLARLEITELDRDRLRRILFEYADHLRLFKRKHNNSLDALQYAKDVTYNLDIYIMKHAKFNSIVLSDLEVRINKLKDQLELFEE